MPRQRRNNLSLAERLGMRPGDTRPAIVSTQTQPQLAPPNPLPAYSQPVAQMGSPVLNPVNPAPATADDYFDSLSSVDPFSGVTFGRAQSVSMGGGQYSGVPGMAFGAAPPSITRSTLLDDAAGMAALLATPPTLERGVGAPGTGGNPQFQATQRAVEAGNIGDESTGASGPINYVPPTGARSIPTTSFPNVQMAQSQPRTSSPFTIPFVQDPLYWNG